MTTSNVSQLEGELWGHPKGLYICFGTELWERFSFYGMKYLLLLYLTKYHLFSDTAGLGKRLRRPWVSTHLPVTLSTASLNMYLIDVTLRVTQPPWPTR